MTTRLKSLSDDALLEALDHAVGRGRRAESELTAHMAEVDRRRLYLGRGCSSMFGYATEVLHMSEGAAYLRIAAARAARKHPVLIEMLADGRLHISGVSRLASHRASAGQAEARQSKHPRRSRSHPSRRPRASSPNPPNPIPSISIASHLARLSSPASAPAPPSG